MVHHFCVSAVYGTPYQNVRDNGTATKKSVTCVPFGMCVPFMVHRTISTLNQKTHTHTGRHIHIQILAGLFRSHRWIGIDGGRNGCSLNIHNTHTHTNTHAHTHTHTTHSGTQHTHTYTKTHKHTLTSTTLHDLGCAARIACAGFCHLPHAGARPSARLRSSFASLARALAYAVLRAGTRGRQC
jgi:hypothetical protein